MIATAASAAVIRAISILLSGRADGVPCRYVSPAESCESGGAARQLSNQLQQAGVVQAAVAARDHGGDQLADDCTERDSHAGLAGRAVTMPMSLWCRASRKPGLNSPASMRRALAGQHGAASQAAAEHLQRRLHVDAVRLEEHDRLGDQLDVARDDELVGGLDGLPRPAGPTWTIVFPTASSTGLAASKSSASPPTMIDRLASIAPASPPLTGASSTRSPRSPAGLGDPHGDVRPDRAHVDVERALCWRWRRSRPRRR